MEKELVTNSSIVAWEIPKTEEPSPWGHKESDATEHTHARKAGLVVLDSFSFGLSLKLFVSPPNLNCGLAE